MNAVIGLVYLGAAACFVIGLHLMRSPVTARRGNTLSATGMAAAVAATLVVLVDAGTVSMTGWVVLAAGASVGTLAGWYAARTVAMTAMPQLVSLFNAVGGGAAALVAAHDFLRITGHGGTLPARAGVPTVLDVVIGAVTFSGSLIASGKLQGVVTSQPVVFRGVRVLNIGLALVMFGGGAYLATGAPSRLVLALVALAALAFGVSMVMPIGGADMPVVISLLNAFTGTAVAMAGFVIGNSVLIIAGALVGASGGILTKLMADAMNRSIPNIIVGGFGTGDSTGTAVAGDGGQVRSVSADDAAIQLAYARKVIIVPGYGLAAAQAQHEVRELAELQRSMGHGYAGIDNELYTDPRTGMFFADAKKGLAQLAAAVKVLVG